MPKIWLITGSGAGLGRVLAEKALAAGETVVATARDTSQLDALAERHGSRVLVRRLDVTNEDEANAAVKAATDTFGRLDVLVNNAGYGAFRPFEETPSEDFRRLVETCFFGVVNLTRAALPVMRRQRAGHIFQISSIGGRIGFPGNAAYSAAKWAVGGFTEALALETAPFGVKVTALEPGGMRTNWGKRASSEIPALLPDYEPSVGAMIKQLEGLWGHETGDPARVAEVILRLAEADALPPHLVLGSDSLVMVRQAEEARAQEAARWEPVTGFINFDAAGSMPELPQG
jgi:NAD(P)-dependent dehydrogenase (short-subunit alcohol dehydrogenase family)